MESKEACSGVSRAPSWSKKVRMDTRRLGVPVSTWAARGGTPGSEHLVSVCGELVTLSPPVDNL